MEETMSVLGDAAINILLVDDSRPVRTVLKTLLCGLGVTRIYEAENREEAFIMARVCRPDLAIIDYDLGAETGVQLVAAFRDAAQSPMPELPLILLSPTGQDHLTAGAREAGVDAILPKPVTARMLGDKIAELTGEADAGLHTVERKQA
jgi:two-component system chemotaxis response regulator CheY